MALGKAAWKETRQRLQELLSNNCSTLKDDQDLQKKYVRTRVFFLSLFLSRSLVGLIINHL